MRKISTTGLLAALVASALLTGCGSTDVGDILGGGRDTGGTSSQSVNDVRGTIDSVNTRDRYIVLNADDTYDRNYLRNTGTGDQVYLYYDDRTTVEYRDQSYRPEDLERGDEIRAALDRSTSGSSRLYAQQIQVLYDSSAGGSSGSSGTLGSGSSTRASDVRGTIRTVDTRARLLEVDTSRYRSNFSTGSSGSYGSDLVTVYYDSGTRVEFRGQTYGPENLERGDEVTMAVRDVGGRLTADQIQVVNDVRSSTGY